MYITVKIKSEGTYWLSSVFKPLPAQRNVHLRLDSVVGKAAKSSVTEMKDGTLESTLVAWLTRYLDRSRTGGTAGPSD